MNIPRKTVLVGVSANLFHADNCPVTSLTSTSHGIDKAITLSPTLQIALEGDQASLEKLQINPLVDKLYRSDLPSLFSPFIHDRFLD